MSTPTASSSPTPEPVPIPESSKPTALTTPRVNLWGRGVIFQVLAVGVLALDLWSKHAVFTRLGSPFGQTDWFFQTKWLSFKFFTTYNEGALWGLGQGMSSVFAAFSVIAIIGVLVWLFVFRAAESLWLTIALALVTGGAFGNLYDRLGLHGEMNPQTGEPLLAVRDFFYFRIVNYDYPIFNVADIALVTGAIMLVIQSLRPLPEEAETETASPGTTPSGSTPKSTS